MSIIGKSWTPKAERSEIQIHMKLYMLTKLARMKSSNLPRPSMSLHLSTKTTLANLKDSHYKARVNLLLWVGSKIAKMTQNWSKCLLQIKTTCSLKVSRLMLEEATTPKTTT